MTIEQKFAKNVKVITTIRKRITQVTGLLEIREKEKEGRIRSGELIFQGIEGAGEAGKAV
jgi:hypothetical protein